MPIKLKGSRKFKPYLEETNNRSGKIMKEAKKKEAKKQVNAKQLIKRVCGGIALLFLIALAHKGLIAYIGSGRQGVVVYATVGVGLLVYAILGIYL